MNFEELIDDTNFHYLMTDREFEVFLSSVKIKWAGGFGTYTNPNRRFFQIKNGWLSVVKYLIECLFATGWDGELLKVEESYGYLRFFSYSVTGKQQILINKIENLSSTICNECAQPGQRYDHPNGWIYTSCHKHKLELLNRYKIEIKHHRKYGI